MGFHGCSGDVAEAVLSGAQNLQASDNDYDWLGSGIYFWLDTAERAMTWAQQRGKKQPSVIGAIINPGNCLNLSDSSHINSIKASYELLRDAASKSGMPMPKNSVPDGQGLCLLRRLDCAVIQLLHTVRKGDNLAEFESVVGVFEEGPPIFPGSGMKEKTHVQIAVRNTDNILGYFKPKF